MNITIIVYPIHPSGFFVLKGFKGYLPTSTSVTIPVSRSILYPHEDKKLTNLTRYKTYDKKNTSLILLRSKFKFTLVRVGNK